jgi:hypothetical protein
VVEVSERRDATFLDNYVKLETCRASARDVGLRVAERIHATRTCCYLRATRRDPLIHLTADDNMDAITHCAMWSYQSGLQATEQGLFNSHAATGWCSGILCSHMHAEPICCAGQPADGCGCQGKKAEAEPRLLRHPSLMVGARKEISLQLLYDKLFCMTPQMPRVSCDGGFKLPAQVKAQSRCCLVCRTPARQERAGR